MIRSWRTQLKVTVGIVLAAGLVGATACNGADDTEVLQTQVEDLRGQVSQLETELEAAQQADADLWTETERLDAGLGTAVVGIVARLQTQIGGPVYDAARVDKEKFRDMLSRLDVIETRLELLAPIPEGITFEVDRFTIEDGKFELRMLDAYWGYDAGADIPSNEGAGIVMTMNVGDTLSIGIFSVSNSRSTIPHNFTIEGLGIDFQPEGRDPYSIKFLEAGTFVVNDSTDPNGHGKTQIVILDAV